MIRDLAVRGGVTGAVAVLAGLLAGLAAGDGAGVVSLVVLAGIAVPVGAIAGWLTFRHAEETVRGIATASNRLAEGELWERVSVTSGATADLVRHFNHMASRMQELVRTTEAGQARLEAVFDAATDAMVAMSADTSVRLVNEAALRLLEVTRDGAVGRAFIESARDFELDALVRRAAETGEPATAAAITFGAKRVPLRAAAVPIRHGGDWAVLLTLSDLTEVQRLDQVRRDFLSNVSHELRTPLASIRALVETMEDGGGLDEEETRAFLARIHQQVERMTALVNELLDLSRIESGAIELRPEPLSPVAVAREAASLVRPRSDARGVAIAVEGEAAIQAEADRASLLRVVTNLLDNAAKFSPAGTSVTVTVLDEGPLVALSVRDQGPGIPEQELSRVFERFYKGEAGGAAGGSGLGLAIVKHLVRAHGGTVEAASPPGGGAVFTVHLPKQFAGGRPPAGA